MKRVRKPLRANDVAGLRRELAALRRDMLRIVRALHKRTHTRTDLAPDAEPMAGDARVLRRVPAIVARETARLDAALGVMKKIVADLEAGR